MTGLRYLKSPTFYDRYLGAPHPSFLENEESRYGVGYRTSEPGEVVVSKWHPYEVARAVATRLAVKCDRRQRRKRVAKKIAKRGGRRRFVTLSYVRRLNAAG